MVRERARRRVAAAGWKLREVVQPHYRKLKRRIADLVFERGDFVHTSAHTELEEFGLQDRERVDYLPSGWWFLRRALRGRTIGPDDVLVDFGSGKGRVVYRAARYPFKRVVGVEISPALNAIARRNVDRNHRRLRCQEIEFITADARDFVVPDDMTIAYFFSPFVGSVFAAVLDNIIASIDRAPRSVTLIYACPVLEREVSATGRFALVRRSRGLHRNATANAIAIFESVPRTD